jgi:hypothetical protein
VHPGLAPPSTSQLLLSSTLPGANSPLLGIIQLHRLLGYHWLVPDRKHTCCYPVIISQYQSVITPVDHHLQWLCCSVAACDASRCRRWVQPEIVQVGPPQIVDAHTGTDGGDHLLEAFLHPSVLILLPFARRVYYFLDHASAEVNLPHCVFERDP